MKIDFNTKATYGDDDDKYIKTKTKTFKDRIITRRKRTTQMLINNNFRFCYLCIWKVSSTNIFRRMQIYEKNIKSKNYIDMELESESDSTSCNGIYIDIDNEE